MGWGLAASLSLGDADSAARLLSRGELVSWMDAARHWYVMTTPQRREKWQNDFRRLIAGLGIASEPGRMPQAVQWEEDGQPYSRVRQLYEVLTMGEEDSEAPERATGQENGQTVSAERVDGWQEQQALGQQAEAAAQGTQKQSTEGDAVAREMAALAVQLKDRVSLLIDSGQYQAAAGIIEQLKAYFPMDEELLKLQERCANHVG